jgi:hypothetical protein
VTLSFLTENDRNASKNYDVNPLRMTDGQAMTANAGVE